VADQILGHQVCGEPEGGACPPSPGRIGAAALLREAVARSSDCRSRFRSSADQAVEKLVAAEPNRIDKQILLAQGEVGV
jgi:hypothetical protein